MSGQNSHPFADSRKTAAVVVTHNRPEELKGSLDIVNRQTHLPSWLIVVDNGDDPAVRAHVEGLAGPNTPEIHYIGSKTNLGGAGGFALGMLTALTLGADWIWCADDDGRPEGPEVLETLLDAAYRHQLAEVSPVVCDIANPDRLAFPLRRGVTWRRNRSELLADGVDSVDASNEILPGIASLFNGALFAAKALERLGVPDYRLFIRGDEVEFHRRLVRSGMPFGTCLTTAYLHPSGSEEFKPILGGKMHTQYPSDDFKRYFTYRNRGYLMSQPGMRKLLPQEYARFAWFFLVQKRDVKGFTNWLSLHRRGRNENFERFQPNQ
ncbi:galactofuranosyltransferase GlfT1 [Corynebacterium sp. H78]|uniref:galactofuranosyltransferase GlfT1 n=1 Tax=Corynebacterium sp. H78 TaxID=3133417 RepID=UPI0030A89207